MGIQKRQASSKGKKGKAGKKAVDPFSKKDWYDVKAPNMFTNTDVGKTPVNRTQGTKLASDGLKGRVFEVSLADLNKDEEQTYRKMKLRCDEVQETSVLTNFHGMDFTSDKIRSLVRKWQTLIEAQIDVKTTDGYLLRLFCIAFTKRRPNQIKKTTYAQSEQIRQIRKKMFEIIQREASSVDLKDLVLKFIPEVIGKEIEKACQGIFPLQNVFIRKCKTLKTPKFDINKLLDLHGAVASSGETGSKVDRGFVEPTPSDDI